MSKFLVLTVLASEGNYGLQTYQNFIGSLSDTGFDGKVVLITTREEIDRLGMGELETQHPCLDLYVIPEPEIYEDLNCYRYRYYQNFLEASEEPFDYVMLSDSRDVIFQRNIADFPFDPDIDLYFAEEEKRIGECTINANWIMELYGSTALETLKEETVLCSGTTIGKRAAILIYLDRLNQKVAEVDDEYHRKFGNLGGIDQGIHNFLYHQNQLAGLNILTVHNRSGLFYTVGHVASDDRERQFLNEQRQFITEGGQVCYCIHQFDRLDPAIADEFNAHSPFQI